ncbi:DUF4222 domain-containing protein [Kluyvera intermedia]|uniref:DUF4222 domain-containing protein n=1 Tax=Kluyvera intermedia TaxID=61648 RepID=UPI003524DFCE
MCTSQELTERWKAAVAGRPPAAEPEPVPISGKRYRDRYGRVVTIMAVGPQRIKFRREGDRDPCEMSYREFERKFTEVGE